MSFLSGRSAPNPGAVNYDKIDLAVTEYVLPDTLALGKSSSLLVDSTPLQTSSIAWSRTYSNVVDKPLLMRLSSSCYNKCIGAKYPADGDLNKGESVCIDKCVAKYNEVQKKVGEKLQAKGAAAGGAPAAGGSAFGSL